MIITGLITLVTAVLFWYIFSLLFQHDTHAACARFFFPDSVTTAYFLTPEERVQAVQRIKVNQAGAENKHWKREQ